MSTKFKQPGNVLTFTAPSGGVDSGVPVQIGQIVVIPCVTAAEGASFEGHVTGVHEVPKVGSQAWAEGAIVYWDDDNTRFTTVAAGHLQAGIAAEAAGNGAGVTTGVVRLDGVARVQEST